MTSRTRAPPCCSDGTRRRSARSIGWPPCVPGCGSSSSTPDTEACASWPTSWTRIRGSASTPRPSTATRAWNGWCGRYGPHRVLFGTGAPVTDDAGPRFQLDHLDLPAADAALIGGGNARALLGRGAP
ncbi:amidohydrolase family protein [Spirillospora sp. NPDC048911]|uniref:amidohydrolase family protein n=1 Tax=Spirillospora sp. NPDC048911 TaxID=3364527 RepID=UPI003717AB31